MKDRESNQSQQGTLSKKARIFLDYAATCPNATIRYKAKNMVLHVYSDAAYLIMTEARSCYAGNFSLSDWPSPRPKNPNPARNVPINTECKTLRNVVSLSGEDKTCGTFNSIKTAIDMQPFLTVLYHKQPVTLLKINNSTTELFVNLGMKPKHSKIWDMKWHWLIDKYFLEKFIVYCYRGKNNDSYYSTKHHPPIYHCQMRPWYIHTPNLVKIIHQTIRLCKGELNRFLGTHSCVYYLMTIRSERKFMTKKCHMVRQLNCPRQHIM